MNRINFIKALFIAPIVAMTKEPESLPTPIEEAKKHLTINIEGRISGKDLFLISTNEKRELLGLK